MRTIAEHRVFIATPGGWMRCAAPSVKNSTPTGNWADQAAAIFKDQKWGPVRTQICFWETRQYEELCNAFGRHLFDVLNLSGKSQRALAWIFPAERLLERDDEICPNIVFIRDVITVRSRNSRGGWLSTWVRMPRLPATSSGSTRPTGISPHLPRSTHT